MATQIPQPAFGQRLRQLRSERGLSQRDLAVGAVNQSYISLLESGARVPTLEVVLHLARVLGVPLDALVDDVELITDSNVDQLRGEQLVDHLLTTSAIDAGDFKRAEERLTRAYRSAIESGSPTAVLTQGLALDRVLAGRGDPPARYRLLTELVPVAEVVGIPEALVRVRTDLGSAARDVGHLGEALDHTERAIREIGGTAFQEGPEHVRLLAVHVSVLSDSGGGAEVVRCVDAMLELVDRIDSPAVAGRAHWAASVALARLGEVERSVRHLRSAGEMLSDPRTPLREWARFSRAAASALMDVGADLAEITGHLTAARVASAALESRADAMLTASLEVRYALACGDPAKAAELAAGVDEELLTGLERVRFVLAVGRARRELGRVEEAARTLRRAAGLCEEASAYRRASQIWREINDLSAAE